MEREPIEKRAGFLKEEAEGKWMGRKAVHETRFRGSVPLPPDPCDRNREAERKRRGFTCEWRRWQEANEERKTTAGQRPQLRRGGRETVEDRDGSEKRRSF
jgi:hypothetical protein